MFSFRNYRVSVHNLAVLKYVWPYHIFVFGYFLRLWLEVIKRRVPEVVGKQCVGEWAANILAPESLTSAIASLYHHHHLRHCNIQASMILTIGLLIWSSPLADWNIGILWLVYIGVEGNITSLLPRVLTTFNLKDPLLSTNWYGRSRLQGILHLPYWEPTT